MHYNFIEIGTSDFDTEIQTCADTDVGISVDPILFYLQRLPAKPHVMRVLAAISDSDGFVDVYHVPETNIRAYGMPDWVRGCNSIGAHHPTVAHMLQTCGIDPATVIQKTSVPKFSMTTFLRMYNVSSCDYLKIDTEGHDTVILCNYIEAVKAGITQPAKRLCFEANSLTPAALVDGTILLLTTELGYMLETRDDNVVMRLRD